MNKKPNAARSAIAVVGITEDIDAPARAPIKLASTSALEEPRKTAKGRLDVPLIVMVANCVLSPISARNTVVNVESNRGRNIVRNWSVSYTHLRAHET